MSREKINIELPHGVTVKVDSDKWWSMSDQEIALFFLEQKTNFPSHLDVHDPFDNSILKDVRKELRDAGETDYLDPELDLDDFLVDEIDDSLDIPYEDD